MVGDYEEWTNDIPISIPTLWYFNDSVTDTIDNV